MRNSKNGYFTRISTLSHKFEIPEGKAWEIVGILLSDGIVESDHDTRSGEMRLCETGKIYEILSQENKRKIQKSKKFKKMKHKEQKEKELP